jgi:Kinesin motor domain
MVADAASAVVHHYTYAAPLQQGSLEGQCFVVMIVAVSPCSNTYEDSLNALKYANRAKEIRVRCPSKVSTFTQDNRCNINAALIVHKSYKVILLYKLRAPHSSAAALLHV